VARNVAKAAGDFEVRPNHLLRALLQEEEGLAAALLERAGLSLESLRNSLPANSESTTLGCDNASIALAAASRHILEAAGELALELDGERIAAGNHVVLAIVRSNEETRTLLEACGLNLARLEEITFAPLAALSLDEPLDLADIAEEMDVSRILDAEANRAREALRVIEDYCRFSLDDAFLTREVKQLRHDLTEAVADGSKDLLSARDTLADVGTAITTITEHTRRSIEAVVEANFKRLEEALRSVEEFSKLRSPAAGQRLEQFRYRSYTLEQAIVLGRSARRKLADARLYVLISVGQCSADIEWTIQEAAAGGAQIFQLREKNISDLELLERAKRVRRATKKAGALFIMNDRPDIARIVRADGVHLGQEDLPVKEVRRIAGAEMLIGVSTHTMAQVRQAVLEGASYIGIGPTFPSGTKSFLEFPGLEFIRRATCETSLPSFAIGGVNGESIQDAIAAGARRVAVGEAVCKSDDPERVSATLRRLLDESWR